MSVADHWESVSDKMIGEKSCESVWMLESFLLPSLKTLIDGCKKATRNPLLKSSINLSNKSSSRFFHWIYCIVYRVVNCWYWGENYLIFCNNLIVYNIWRDLSQLHDHISHLLEIFTRYLIYTYSHVKFWRKLTSKNAFTNLLTIRHISCKCWFRFSLRSGILTKKIRAEFIIGTFLICWSIMICLQAKKRQLNSMSKLGLS